MAYAHAFCDKYDGQEKRSVCIPAGDRSVDHIYAGHTALVLLQISVRTAAMHPYLSDDMYKKSAALGVRPGCALSFLFMSESIVLQTP